jgi:hypothetical protein
MRQWIAECLLVSEKADLYGVKKCTGFALIHERGGSPKELKAISVGTAADPKELAAIFKSTADTYAGGVPGVQQFQLLAFFDGQDEPKSFYPFRKNGHDETHGGLMTEGPTPTGVLGQLMRLFEANTRITHQYSASTFSTMERMFDRLDRRNARLESEQHDLIELAKELIFQKASDEHNRKVALQEMEQSAQDRQLFMRLLPGVANRVFGKEIFPQSTVDGEIIDQMAESLTEEQIGQLSSILTPEQWGLLADRLVTALQKKQAREDEKAKREEHFTPSNGSNGSNGAHQEAEVHDE